MLVNREKITACTFLSRNSLYHVVQVLWQQVYSPIASARLIIVKCMQRKPAGIHKFIVPLQQVPMLLEVSFHLNSKEEWEV